jgi:hypothetical protein
MHANFGFATLERPGEGVHALSWVWTQIKLGRRLQPCGGDGITTD